MLCVLLLPPGEGRVVYRYYYKVFHLSIPSFVLVYERVLCCVCVRCPWSCSYQRLCNRFTTLILRHPLSLVSTNSPSLCRKTEQWFQLTI